MNLDYIYQCISGNGPLQAYVVMDPITEITLRPNAIFKIVANKKVLHLGCTDHLDIINEKINNGKYLHRQLSFVSSQCWGLDINRQAVDHLRRYDINNIAVTDITQPNIEIIEQEQWDYLLMAEVLEHINDPVSFIKQIGTHYRKNINSIIITVPNAFGYIHFLQAFNNGRESVNSDHRYWFSPYTLCKVAHEAGLIIDDLIMCCYENSEQIVMRNPELFKEKPILLDTILLVAHWATVKEK